MALKNISRGRVIIGQKILPILNESYSRAYPYVVELQHLSELEEVIEYKRSSTNEKRKKQIESLWGTRLNHAQKDPNIWSKMLAIRGLAIAKEQRVMDYIRQVSICKEQNRLSQCKSILLNLANEISPETNIFAGQDIKIPCITNELSLINFTLLKINYQQATLAPRNAPM